MKTYLPAVTAAAFCGVAAASPIPVNSGALVYTQNFDTLPTESNNAAASSFWTDDSTLNGWSFYTAGNSVTPTGPAGLSYTYYVSDGSAPPQTLPLQHGFYSLGAIASTDRALGLCPTTALGELSAMVIFQNTGATPVKLAHMKYTAEVYRANNTANNKDSLYVWWKTGATDTEFLTNTTALCSSNNTQFVLNTNTSTPTSYYITGWNNLPEFTYTYNNPVANAVLAPTTQAINSNVASSVVIQPNQYFALRFANINDAGTDAVQGLDDLELTFEASSGCVVDGNVSGISRLPGADANSAADDTVQFTINAAATSGSPGGWKVPAGGLAGGTTGAYGTAVAVTVPIAAFDPSGTVKLRIEDSADSNCFKLVDVSAPPFLQKVTATNSPLITFTPAALNAGAYSPPSNNQSELGWTSIPPASVVKVQPDSGAFTGTLKYWELNSANTTFSTNPVDVSALAGQTLQGQFDLSFYTTSNTGLDAADVIKGYLEVALDGDFTNIDPGNLLTATFMDVSADQTTFAESIAAATPYIELNTVGYPATDFIFHPFVKTISIPAGAPATARARITVFGGADSGTSEHLLVDNVKFSLAVTAADADADGIPDDYETANGLNPNSNADRNTDLDGDGQSNYQEYLAGTAANDPASVLRITAAGLTPSNEITGSWSSVAGKRYQVQISPDLGNTAAWTALGNPVTATGPSMSVPAGVVIPAGNPRYFLRVVVVP
ncbi:MAG TPA: hypothetical protein VHM91_07320 [Verrucomicrobiales bacterium]|nr:hypothetical protein [Verrucomicrobiales bacterium]